MGHLHRPSPPHSKQDSGSIVEEGKKRMEKLKDGEEEGCEKLSSRYVRTIHYTPELNNGGLQNQTS